MAGASRQTGTGRDYKRGIRPVAVQVPRTGHFKALGESPLTGGQRYAYGRISENRERRKENSEKEKAEISIKRPCRYSVFISENQQGFSYAIDVII